MIDPLSEMVSLLNPEFAFSKRVLGAGAWRIKRTDIGEPFYCVVLSGECELTLEVNDRLALTTGDFVLIPQAFDFTFSSKTPIAGPEVCSLPEEISDGVFRLGEKEQAQNVDLLVGHCRFDSLDAKLLVSLLPKLIHIREATKLTSLVKMLSEESSSRPPGYYKVIGHLLEILLIEALRTNSNTPQVPGLLVGLADERIGESIRAIHKDVSQPKSVEELAKVAALSRSAFFYRFRHTVGVTPMEYQMAWRMTIAQNLLKKKACSMAQIAEKVGYKSASAFSLAFTNYMGSAPSSFRKMY
mgnify:CR=1 FL=1